MKYERTIALMILDVLHEAESPMLFTEIAAEIGLPDLFIAHAFQRLAHLNYIRPIAHGGLVKFAITTIGDIHYLITMEAA